MHSRIFLFCEKQNLDLEALQEAIDKKSLVVLSDSELYDELEGGYDFFDYISSDTKFDADVEWLSNVFKDVLKTKIVDKKRSIASITILKSDLESYFNNKNSKIAEYISNTGYHAEDEMWIYGLNNLVCKRYSTFFFVGRNNNWFDYCQSIDSFLVQALKYCNNYKKDCVELYVYATYDYHN